VATLDERAEDYDRKEATLPNYQVKTLAQTLSIHLNSSHGSQNLGVMFPNYHVEGLSYPRLGYESHGPSRSRVQEHYRATSLTRKHIPLGPYRRPLPRVLGGS